jgi:DMSO/TMAO reductase YedYZ molybdopterin-dependent catalytic subunit
MDETLLCWSWMMNKPNVLTGVLVGAGLMMAVIAVFAAGAALFGLPFVPFDLFDWLVRTLQTELVPRLVQLMSSTITALQLGRVDTVAKLAEQTMAVIGLIVIGAVAGGIFFAVRRARRADTLETAPGVVLGLLLGVPLALISLSINQTTASNPLPAAGWILLVFLGYGYVLNYVYSTLAFRTTPVTAAPTPPNPYVQVVDRRQFLLQVGGATAAITVAGAGLSALLNGGSEAASTAIAVNGVVATPEAVALPSDLPNANDPVAPAPGTRPEVTPLQDHYRIDIRTTPLEIPEEGYTLRFTSALGDGNLQTLNEMTLDQIRNDFEAVDAYITMSCISNPVAGDLISTIRWTGVPMRRILEEVGVPEGATHLLIRGGDDFDETVAIETINADERILLAYAWEGQPLLPKHGFPLRIHIPDLYGMKQPKWITEIEFISGDREGYWVRRGWDKEARVRSTSVIDTVSAPVQQGDTTLVPIGGIAWAGARGLSAVEVRVDGGEWVEAELRAPISDRTWQLWRYDWPFAAGTHTFDVRCIEADGTPQIDARAGTFPSGATGIHNVVETLADA